MPQFDSIFPPLATSGTVLPRPGWILGVLLIRRGNEREDRGWEGEGRKRRWGQGREKVEGGREGEHGDGKERREGEWRG